MALNIEKFTGGVIGIIVAVILVVTVAVPIISDNQVASTVSNSAALNSMINILPILLVVGIIMACIGAFLYYKKG